jgi:uncharacterized protein involved in response to NO
MAHFDVKPDPYRIFFPLGIASGLAGVSIWPLYYFGLTAGYSGRAHGLVQTDGFLYSFIAGFLLTAVPRFTGTDNPSRFAQYFLAAALIVSAAASERRAFAVGTAAFVVAHFTLLSLLARRFMRRQQNPPSTFILIGMGLLSGSLGAVLSCAVAWEVVSAFWDLLGKRLLTEGMVMLFVLGVGGFLGPRLLGFAELPKFAPPIASGGAGRPPPARPIIGSGQMRWAAIGSAILFSLVAEYSFGLEWMAFLRAAVVTAVVLGTLHLWRLPVARTTLSWCVWVAHWLIVTSLWLVALAPRYHVDFLHVLFIGGFSLLILAVGTRVALSHGGHDLGQERRSWPLRIGLTMGLTAMLARIGAPFAPVSYFEHLALAALLWMAGMMCWGAYIGSVIGTAGPRSGPRVRPLPSSG